MLYSSRFAVEAGVHQLAKNGELEFVHLVVAVTVTARNFREDGFLSGGWSYGLKSCAFEEDALGLPACANF